MKWPVYLSLVMCAAAGAAEPPAVTRAADNPPAEVAAPVNAPPTQSSAVRKPLDLRIGDIRNYMTPDEFRALLTGREEERNTVVVEANVPLLPVKTEQPIPSGLPLLPLWWAATHPTQSWRILVPDINAPRDGPTLDKVPPPIFRWGP